MTITLKVLRACIRCNWIPLLGIEGLIVLISRLLLLDTITNTSGWFSARPFSLNFSSAGLCEFLLSYRILAIVRLKSRFKILSGRDGRHLWHLLLIFLHLQLPGVVFGPASMTDYIIFYLFISLSYLLSLDVFLNRELHTVSDLLLGLCTSIVSGCQ